MLPRSAAAGTLTALIICVLSTAASAATLNVPDSYSTIQAAISAATTGDEVVVAAGTYHERIDFGGKAITVRGTAPYDPAVVAATIINGSAGGSVVTFAHGETAAAVLTGLTITNGRANGGGIACSSASPTITRNVISANTCPSGGHGAGIFCNAASPTISANTISGNSSEYGAGICLYGGSATISGNLIRSNSGSGIYCSYSSASVSGNIIAGNTGATIGGGILAIGGSDRIVGNTLHANAAGAGGGICFYDGAPTLSNTIITSSTAGGGVVLQHDAAPTIKYCNVYGNTGGNYSGLTDPVGTNGNISVDPRYADATSFRLQSTVGRWTGTSWTTDSVDSPCIDTGDPSSSYAGEPPPHGYRVNMGYDGNTCYASKTKVRVYIQQTDRPYPTIGEAIAAATAGQTVVINQGTYHERINFSGKAITVRSSQPGDPAVVAATVINGDAGGSVVSLKSGEGTGASLCGLTITGGSGTGAGVYCLSTSPSISNCVITGNTSGASNSGGGIYCSGGKATISSNTISGNNSPSGGGLCLLASYGGTITGNTITGNTGSGIYSGSSSPVITGNIITSNSGSTATGTSLGGGIACSSGAAQITGNTLSGNTATLGGGLYLYGGSPQVKHNIIVASTAGYGIYIDRYTYPTIKYNDVYNNLAANYGNTFDHTGSEGNISKDPLFVAGYRLSSTGGHWGGSAWVKDKNDSPCLDAGDPAAAYGSEPAPNGSRLNLGYDGNTLTASKSPIPAVTRCLPRGAGVPTNTIITLRFSVPMKQGSVQASLYLNGQRVPEGTFTWTGLKLTYKPKTPLEGSRRYQVKLKATAKSRVGVYLEKDKIWNFTTEPAAASPLLVSAAATRAGVQVSLSLASAADVTLMVRNLAGRPIATLPVGALAAGAHTRLWNRRSTLGGRAPAGPYLVEAVARGSDGSQTRALAPVQLR